MTRLDRALDLAAKGYYVFPWYDAPRPYAHVKDWENAATRNPDTLRQWWAKWPDATPAIAPHRSGLAVIDIDNKPEPRKPNGFVSAEEAGAPLYAKVEAVSSGGRGKHLYYRGVNGTKTDINGLAGIDSRGRGGLVKIGDAYGELPPAAEITEPVPAAYRVEPGKATGATYRGGFAELLKHDNTPLNEDGHALVARLLAKGSIGHAEMIADQVAIRDLGTGWKEAARAYRAHYLRGEWDTALYRERFDKALDGLAPPGGVHPITAREAREAFGFASASVSAEPVSETPRGWLVTDMAERVAAARRGEITTPKPTIGTLHNGTGLFYPGKVNGIAGASGGGKSWIALQVCLDEAAKGRHSIIVDYEDTADTLAIRLTELGVDPGLEDYVHHVAAQGRYEEAREAFEALVVKLDPSIVVVDSTGEALASEGLNPNADEEIAGWFQLMPRRVANAGPGVVLIDHQAKAADGGLWPIGSQRKRAAINGVQYVSTVVNPFARGENGQVDLVCAKDRAGSYPQSATIAHVAFDTRADGTLNVSPVAPIKTAAPAAMSETDRLHKLREELCSAAKTYPGMSANKLYEQIGGRKSPVLQQVRWLVDQGYLSINAKGGHDLARSYTRVPRSSASAAVAAFAAAGEGDE